MTEPVSWTPERAGAAVPEAEPVDARALRRRLRAALPDAEEEALVRPALTQLVQDQGELVVELLEGFSTRRELLEWEQSVVIHTLGQLPEGWLPEIASHPPTVARLLGRAWGPAAAPSRRRARETRRGLAADALLPACHAALEAFRWSAVERVDHLDDRDEGDAPDPVEPEEQRYPAMRPELGQLAEQQRRTLESLLDGFGSEDELLVWCQQLQGATYAEIAPGEATAPYFERPLRQFLVRSEADARARFVRRSWAAEFLLPAFRRASAALGERAAEVTAGESPVPEGGTSSIS